MRTAIKFYICLKILETQRTRCRYYIGTTAVRAEDYYCLSVGNRCYRKMEIIFQYNKILSGLLPLSVFRVRPPRFVEKSTNIQAPEYYSNTSTLGTNRGRNKAPGQKIIRKQKHRRKLIYRF